MVPSPTGFPSKEFNSLMVSKRLKVWVLFDLSSLRDFFSGEGGFGDCEWICSSSGERGRLSCDLWAEGNGRLMYLVRVMVCKTWMCFCVRYVMFVCIGCDGGLCRVS